MKTPRHGLTIRLRLTILIGTCLILAGSILLGLTYLLVRNNLNSNPNQVRTEIARRLGIDPTRLRPAPSVEPSSTSAHSRHAVVHVLFKQVQQEITDNNLHRMLVESGVALAVMAVGSIGLGWVVAGRMLRPLHTITTAARQLSDVNLHERIALDGPADELKELADTFDAMLERLDRAFMSQQRFVANASHELRTPLAVMRTEVDVALADPNATVGELRAMAEVVRDATIRSEALVDGLLTLARTGAARPSDRPMDLGHLAARVTDRLAPDAAALELTLDLRLERLVENLVQNALQYNVHAGWVSVATRTDADTASLRVANSGPLVPTEAVAGLFERFRRLDEWDHHQGHRGFGLGLSIVDAVARAHGGTATAEAQPDGGLLVVVELPAAAVSREVALARS